MTRGVNSEYIVDLTVKSNFDIFFTALNTKGSFQGKRFKFRLIDTLGKFNDGRAYVCTGCPEKSSTNYPTFAR